MKKQVTVILFLITALFLSGCSNSQSSQPSRSDDKIDIFTTVYPLQYFAQVIGGPYVNVETVYPPGTDEHSFEPSQKDIIQMAEADLFFYIGYNLEGFVTKAKPILEDEGVKTIAVGESVVLDDKAAHTEEEHTEDAEDAHIEDEHTEDAEDAHIEDEHTEDAEDAHIEDEHTEDAEDAHIEDEHTEDAEDAHIEDEHTEDAEDAHIEDEHTEDTHKEDAHTADDGHNHGDVDPHLWLDPIYASQMAATIKDELVKKIPEQSDYFEAQYNKLNEKLQTLDGKLAVTIHNSKTDEIIVSHGAYGYWEKRYGLKQISVTGLSGSDEPSQKDLENIVKTAKEHDLHYVVFEQNVSSKLTEIIQNEIGAKALTLHNLSVLTNADVEAGADYESLMNQNIETLNTALNN